MTPQKARTNLDKALKDAFDADTSGKIVYEAVIPKWRRDGQPPPANLSIAGLSAQKVEAMRPLIDSIMRI